MKDSEALSSGATSSMLNPARLRTERRIMARATCKGVRHMKWRGSSQLKSALNTINCKTAKGSKDWQVQQGLA
jgi:hypothetical protein